MLKHDHGWRKLDQRVFAAAHAFAHAVLDPCAPLPRGSSVAKQSRVLARRAVSLSLISALWKHAGEGGVLGR